MVKRGVRAPTRLDERIAALSRERHALLTRRVEQLEKAGALPTARGEREKGPLRLIAYVVPHRGERPDTDVLRRHVERRLPSSMVPSGFRFLDRLPRTHSGKLDRGALIAHEVDVEAEVGTKESEATDSPRNEQERILLEVWCEILEQEAIGVHENFFEAGGDSLLSIRVLARARERGLALTPEQFFESPTVAGQAIAAERVEVHTAGKEADEVPERASEDRFTPEEFPLAGFDQEELDRVSQLLDETSDSDEH